MSFSPHGHQSLVRKNREGEKSDMEYHKKTKKIRDIEYFSNFAKSYYSKNL